VKTDVVWLTGGVVVGWLIKTWCEIRLEERRGA